MTTFNMMTGRTQVLVDEQQLQQMQAEVARRGVELERLRAAMETLGAVNTPAHFMAAAMGLCNELASRWSAERVGIGLLRGRYVRLRALSHTEKITRNMQLVQDIEAGMEECLDQDVEVLLPPPKDASFVYRLTEKLAERHGPSAVCSFPLRRKVPGAADVLEDPDKASDVVGVLTLERKSDKPFKLEEIEALRLTCDLFTARLVDLYEHDRWIGAKAARNIKRAIAWGFMAKHTWAKVAAIAVAGFLGYALLFDTAYRVEAPFTFEATEQYVIQAPIKAPIKRPYARVGDMVWGPATVKPFDDLNAASPLVDLIPARNPSLLVELDVMQYVFERGTAVAQRDSAIAKASEARGTPDKNPDADMADEEAKAQQARIDEFDFFIRRATKTSPIDGVVFKGDLDGKLGAMVNEGDELFEVGQTDKLRADLAVPEDQVGALRTAILELKPGAKLHGELKATSFPGEAIRFSVDSLSSISPVAEMVGTKNVFKVRVTLEPSDIKPWIMPGIEGLAKVDIGQRRVAWVWTHRMINWVRMKMWW